MPLPQVKPHSRAVTIVQEVAAREGVDFTDLPPLYNMIDPDALDALADSLAESGQGKIEFTYCDHEILIDSDGHVIVDPHAIREIQPSQSTVNTINVD